MGTLPGWDFGTKKFGRITVKMGDTLKAAVVDRYTSVRGGSLGTCSVPHHMVPPAYLPAHPALTLANTQLYTHARACTHTHTLCLSSSHCRYMQNNANGSVPSKAGPTGTLAQSGVKARISPAGSGGGASANDTRPQRDMPGGLSSINNNSSTLGAGKVRVAGGAGGSGGGAAPANANPSVGAPAVNASSTSWGSSERPTNSGGGGVVVQLGGADGLAASVRYPAQPTTSDNSSEDTYGRTVAGTSDKFGTVQSRPPPDPSAAAAAAVGSATMVTRKGSGLQPLSIPNPATASPERALLQQQPGTSTVSQSMTGRGATGGASAAAAAAASAVASMDPGPRPAGESQALLGSVLLPSLASLGARGGGSTQQLASSLQEQLRQLEKQLPGSCSQLTHELLVRLAAATDPAVQPMRAAASALLGPQGGSGAHTQGGGAQGGLLPTRKVGALGPLGEFLLGQWQQEAANEAALLARGAALGAKPGRH